MNWKRKLDFIIPALTPMVVGSISGIGACQTVMGGNLHTFLWQIAIAGILIALVAGLRYRELKNYRGLKKK